LRFVALGGLPAGLLEELAVEVSRWVGLPCRAEAVSATAPELEGRLLDGRAQLDGDGLLAALELFAARGGGHLVVGVTPRDVGRRVFRFVFGLARPGGAAVLVSTARLDPEHEGGSPNRPTIARRAAAEVLHELGHALGLGHCPRADCVMHFSADVESIDLRGLRFCASCAGELPPGTLPHGDRALRGP
jgi:archaemetzincin